MKEYGMKEKASEEVSETEASEEEEVEETEASELVEEDSVDTSEIAMSSEQEDELSTARASLQEWVESNIMK
jgi:hypothetical protein